MLGLFLKLGPIAAGLLGSVGSIAVVSAGFWLWNNLIDNPTIIRIERATIEAEIGAAAAKARLEETIRQAQIGNQALAKAQRDADLAEDAHRANILKIQEEAKSYAAERLADGRPICTITQRDLDFLDGRVLLPGIVPD